MRIKFTQLVVAVALICAIGGQWAILQSIAWIGMTVSYSQNSTLKEALVKTFDGKHPCKICKAVQEGKKSERQNSLLKVEVKLELWAVRSASLLDPPPHFLPAFPESSFALLRAQSPPTPPPRLA